MKTKLRDKTIGIIADIITAVCSGITNFCYRFSERGGSIARIDIRQPV